MYKRRCQNLNFISIWPEKTLFLRVGLGSSSMLWDLHQVQTWIFTPVCQRVKTKSQNVLVVIPTFVEVTGQKLVGEPFCLPPTPPPPISWIGLIKIDSLRSWKKINHVYLKDIEDLLDLKTFLHNIAYQKGEKL